MEIKAAHARFFDFVEIGTSDFDTLIQIADDTTVGLSIDAVDFYLDRLPAPQNCRKLNAAISSQEGEVTVYFIPPQKLSLYGLPDWLRGCNCINFYHPAGEAQVRSRNLSPEHIFDSKQVPLYTLLTVLRTEGVSGVYYIKTDTEGHDPVILEAFFKTAPKELYPHRLQFESNVLSGSHEISSLLITLLSNGYDLNWKTAGGDGSAFLTLNLHRLQNKSRFTKAGNGYYLGGYPPNYDPKTPPHDNTLESAQAYCREHGFSGVTFQYNRYEVRVGKHLLFDKHNLKVTSWVLV